MKTPESQIILAEKSFGSSWYQRHNQRRQEHLASLNLDINGKSVLELGAGIGDHSIFFYNNNCKIIVTDAREECVHVMKNKFKNLDKNRIEAHKLDIENPPTDFNKIFDIVYCYGLLYHISKPEFVIEFISNHCRDMLLLESCVSTKKDLSINLVSENRADVTQSFGGGACRPTRQWIYNELKKYFNFVYIPITQPNHSEFPIDWTTGDNGKHLTRAVFIASKNKIINPLLSAELINKQTYNKA